MECHAVLCHVRHTLSRVPTKCLPANIITSPMVICTWQMANPRHGHSKIITTAVLLQGGRQNHTISPSQQSCTLCASTFLHTIVLGLRFRSPRDKMRQSNQLPSICVCRNFILKQLQASARSVGVCFWGLEAQLQHFFNVATPKFATHCIVDRLGER